VANIKAFLLEKYPQQGGNVRFPDSALKFH
jgi:hypothetical protein